MSKHIVVGAGLGGLYLANRLINQGVKPENIVIIEKREENHYTRPGHMVCETFGIVANNLGIPTPHSPAHHIKELERVMYENLRKLPIEFIDETFVALQPQTETQPKGVITCARDGTQHTYPADYVFDCTGTKARVAQAVNDYCQTTNAEPAFKTGALVDINPIPDHLIANVIIPNYRLLPNFMPQNAESVPANLRQSSAAKNIEAKERLSALGWPYEAFPSFNCFPTGIGKDKVCVYMETPPDLPKAQHREWIQLLLDLYSDGRVKDYAELKPSRKYGEKPRFVGFKISPYVVNKVIHESENLPSVIMAFDSVKGYDYRIAHGVSSGIICCESLLSNMTITDGRIQRIDSIAIERETFEYINGKHKNQLTSILTTRQEAIDNALDYFSEMYEKAARELPQDETAKAQGYQAIARQLAYQAAMTQFAKLDARERQPVKSLGLLNKCVRLLTRAHTLLQDCETPEKQDISEKLQGVVDSLVTEITAFDIEPELTEDDDRNARLNNLFKSIQKNAEQLAITPASQSIQDKAQQTVQKISLHQGEVNRRRPSITLDLAQLGPILQLLFLLQGPGPSVSREPTRRPGFFSAAPRAANGDKEPTNLFSIGPF